MIVFARSVFGYKKLSSDFVHDLSEEFREQYKAERPKEEQSVAAVYPSRIKQIIKPKVEYGKNMKADYKRQHFEFERQMKGALSLDMLRRSDMTVLERQRSRQQQQQEQRFRTRFTRGGPDPELENGWSDVKIHHQLPGLVFGSLDGSSSSNDSVSTTSPAMAAAAENSSGQENVSSGGFKKLKAHHLQNAKAVVEEHNLEESIEADSKVTEENSKKRCCISRKSVKEEAATKVEFEKPDYIHVRARRGQATDSHSLAERLRREKISERMRYLQGLVPGCATITGKAGMLDEIINYVQSLQHQVEFLSMKLATVNPSLEYNNTGNFFLKEITHAPSPSFQMCGIFSETPNCACLLTDASQEVGSSRGLDFEMNSPDMGLRSLPCAPLSVPADAFFDSSCLAQTQPSTSWDVELQSLYIMAFDQGRAM